MVQLVRAEVLCADDLVKADWEETWKPAATVVGLFKMAGREDVLARWEAEKALAEEEAARAAQAAVDQSTEISSSPAECPLVLATSDDLDLLLGGAGSTANRAETTAAIRDLPDSELDSVQVAHTLNDTSTSCNDVGEKRRSLNRHSLPGDPSVTSRIQATIEAAVEEADVKGEGRERACRPSLWQRFRHVDVNGTGTSAFRWGAALLFANIVAVSILSWSELQSQRFPERAGSPAGLQVFPFWGPCSSREYTFLLIDVAVLAGFCGYLAARHVQRRVTESP